MAKVYKQAESGLCWLGEGMEVLPVALRPILPMLRTVVVYVTGITTTTHIYGLNTAPRLS